MCIQRCVQCLVCRVCMLLWQYAHTPSWQDCQAALGCRFQWQLGKPSDKRAAFHVVSSLCIWQPPFLNGRVWDCPPISCGVWLLCRHLHSKGGVVAVACSRVQASILNPES